MYGIKKLVTSDVNGVLTKTFAVIRLADGHAVISNLTALQAVNIRNALNADAEALDYNG